MLLSELFESDGTVSLKKNAKKPIKPEKSKLAFPKKEAWHHVSGEKNGSGWSQVDKTTGDVEDTTSVKSISAASTNKVIKNRETAPKGVNQKYKKFVSKSSKGIF